MMFNEDFHSKCSVLEEEKTQWSFTVYSAVDIFVCQELPRCTTARQEFE